MTSKILKNTFFKIIGTFFRFEILKIMSNGVLNQPERVLRRIFELVNQTRAEYGLQSLIFSKELSFLAGTHSIDMSRRDVPVGHSNYQIRESQVPLALAFSENVASCDPCDDPGKTIMLTWLKKATSFSRIQGDYTHTGIGVAENANGNWFCTQIFATFKSKISRKDAILISGRFVNSFRRKNNLNPLIMTIPPASILLGLKKQKTTAMTQLSASSIKNLFEECVEADFIYESIPKTEIPPIEDFLKIIQDSKTYTKVILKEFTHVSFLYDSISEKEVGCALLLANCNFVKVKIPKNYLACPFACKILQYLNDYRKYKGLKPIIISLQWCEIAQRYCDKLVKKDTDMETRKISSKIHRMFPSSRVNVGVYLIPWTLDPIQEIFLMWVSHPITKQIVLDQEFNTLGFGLAAESNLFVYTTRIIGFKEVSADKLNDEYYATKGRKEFKLGNLTSDEDDEGYGGSFVQMPNFNVFN